MKDFKFIENISLYKCHNCNYNFCKDHMIYINIDINSVIPKRYQYDIMDDNIINICDNKCIHDLNNVYF
jgi:hypothetical protein